ncbi:hypothetical protein RHMOL_Rhmol03G0260800 [Rhododendron molle]|uniref:Uncharacterized protein n=1 Tax=Rhododendron molle TaxID=49168 RepID=A0ACC0PJW2_RHOML|nr:hypothetical protein RHMOL_Rhmol03G0260800 [Rhododendron molle]
MPTRQLHRHPPSLLLLSTSSRSAACPLSKSASRRLPRPLPCLPSPSTASPLTVSFSAFHRLTTVAHHLAFYCLLPPSTACECSTWPCGLVGFAGVCLPTSRAHLAVGARPGVASNARDNEGSLVLLSSRVMSGQALTFG